MLIRDLHDHHCWRIVLIIACMQQKLSVTDACKMMQAL